jgi:hypothetical protein
LFTPAAPGTGGPAVAPPAVLPSKGCGHHMYHNKTIFKNTFHQSSNTMQKNILKKKHNRKAQKEGSRWKVPDGEMGNQA